MITDLQGKSSSLEFSDGRKLFISLFKCDLKIIIFLSLHPNLFLWSIWDTTSEGHFRTYKWL